MSGKSFNNHTLALSDLFRVTFGNTPHTILPMQGAGSGRKYFRLSGETAKVVGSWNPDPEEHKAFIQISRIFYSLGLPVPETIAVDEPSGYCLLTDLGDLTVLDWLESVKSKPGHDEAVRSRYQLILKDLIRFQLSGHNLSLPPYDRDAALYDLNYFRFCFLRPSGIKHSDSLLDKEFRHLASLVDNFFPKGFMYRDFQARNILIQNNNHYYIDYQGAKYGPLIYDVVSLLWQARAGLPQKLRELLVQDYIEAIGAQILVDSTQMHDQFGTVALLRLLQVAGAYGYRGWLERKHHFLASLPELTVQLNWILKNWPVSMPKEELFNVIQQMADKRWPLPSNHIEGLHLNILSFSYMKGIPYDLNGNGGGYVFDCRLLPNPGRNQQLKDFTGIDPEIVDFFKHHAEVDSYLNTCEQLVLNSINAYQNAGYLNLQVCFGCTGGKHRSVYCAEKLAERLKNYPGVTVSVTHQDLNI